MSGHEHIVWAPKNGVGAWTGYETGAAYPGHRLLAHMSGFWVAFWNYFFEIHNVAADVGRKLGGRRMKVCDGWDRKGRRWEEVGPRCVYGCMLGVDTLTGSLST